MTDVAMPHHQSNNQPHRCEATTTGTQVATSQSATWPPDDRQRRGQSPLPLLFANPGARCHISNMATGQRTIIVRRPISMQHNTTTTMLHNGKVSTRTATRAHHHPPRQWPITTPSIGDEDPGPAPPHECCQWPSTTPQMTATAQHHPTNSDDNGPLPAPPHKPAPTNDDNGPLSAPTNPLRTMNMAHHDPLPTANTAHHDPIPTVNTTHHLPLPTARTAQHQHPHGAPHPTNGKHHPPPPTIFDDGPPPAPTNCEDGPAPHANGDDGPSPPPMNGNNSPAQSYVVYVS